MIREIVIRIEDTYEYGLLEINSIKVNLDDNLIESKPDHDTLVFTGLILDMNKINDYDYYPDIFCIKYGNLGDINAPVYFREKENTEGYIENWRELNIDELNILNEHKGLKLVSDNDIKYLRDYIRDTLRDKKIKLILNGTK